MRGGCISIAPKDGTWGQFDGQARQQDSFRVDCILHCTEGWNLGTKRRSGLAAGLLQGGLQHCSIASKDGTTDSGLNDWRTSWPQDSCSILCVTQICQFQNCIASNRRMEPGVNTTVRLGSRTLCHSISGWIAALPRRMERGVKTTVTLGHRTRAGFCVCHSILEWIAVPRRMEPGVGTTVRLGSRTRSLSENSIESSRRTQRGANPVTSLHNRTRACLFFSVTQFYIALPRRMEPGYHMDTTVTVHTRTHAGFSSHSISG